MSNIVEQKNIANFKKLLQSKKQDIDKQISITLKLIQNETLSCYGAYPVLTVDTLGDILTRGGKRIRGALTIYGYQIAGGADKKMIVQAAVAVEMMHAYILIIDDIQDRSRLRRGGPTAHISLEDYHRSHQLGDRPEHFGLAMALNAALVGAHTAQSILATLDAPQDSKLKALNIMNQAMVTTAHGQTNDIMGEVVEHVDEKDVEQVMLWKTASYTFQNPLQLGLVLANSEPKAVSGVDKYSMHAGRAFQISDDILGVFASSNNSGKSPTDDIKEGKRTLLSVYALNNAQSADKNFLLQMLGNAQLSPAEFEKCKQIIVDSGALDYAKKELVSSVKAAKKSISAIEEQLPGADTSFLHGLVEYLQIRQV